MNKFALQCFHSTDCISGIEVIITWLFLVYIIHQSVLNAVVFRYNLVILFVQGTLVSVAVICTILVAQIVRKQDRQIPVKLWVCLTAICFASLLCCSNTVRQFVYSKQNTVNMHRVLFEIPPYYEFFVLPGEPETLIVSQATAYYHTKLDPKVPFWARKTVRKPISLKQDLYLKQIAR